MQRRDPTRWLECHNQRTSFVQMLFQVFPLSANCKRTESLFPEVAFHVGSVDATSFGGIEHVLDLDRVGVLAGRPALLALPVLHHHGNAGCATAVLLLLDE